ncbi:sodium-independent sulfate anion transporter-like isoform X3 [Anoplophora glabripennis]|uniref:sodium-independent sulfate anion transporter-like isoform X4 n=1 Tax=Anoplophora glabripennis TaxID=217634 RepID=UPI000874F252|nr:sodium-independent sulfate anion transporter-like isoform X4 [Anoplophora glabripennis]XP_023313180.1 sodium-independent sulfate anion transporter-like isoform X3 [Anoplophora glabripennis]
MREKNKKNIFKTCGYSLSARQIIKKRLPILAWLPAYTFGTFLQDILAGFTVGLTEIPQGIAYALVAGLPSQYGLYSGFMGCFVYFLLGSCKDLNVGPTAIMALMIQPFVTSMGAAGAVLLCFLSGCIIFILGLLHLGFIVEFFSYPVIAGFTTAAALNIASSQIKSLLGIAGKSQEFLESWIYVVEHIKETRKWDAVLGFTTIVFLVITKEIRRYGTLKIRPEWSRNRNILGIFLFMFSLARNAIAVIVGTLLAYNYYEDDNTPFRLTGNVTGGLPEFTAPPFTTTFNGTNFAFTDMIREYGAVIIFCPLVAVLEHIAIAKSFSKGRTLDATQELIALGMCNIMASFVQSMPITGSFTRTAVNNASGVKTTAGGIITGAMVLLALGFLTSTFRYIPKATLAAVIMVAMYYLCEFHAFLLLWKTKKIDLIPLTATLVCSLLISLEYGILIGIATNMIFVLYSSARPKLDIERRSGDVYLVKLKTGLHFAAAEYVRENILFNCNAEKSTVVIDGKYVGNIDATVAKSFNVLKEELELRDQKLIFVNFKESVMNTCVGVNKEIRSSFRDRIEQIPEVPTIARGDMFTVQSVE